MNKVHPNTPMPTTPVSTTTPTADALATMETESSLKLFARLHSGSINLNYALFSPQQLVEDLAEQAAQATLGSKVRVHCFTTPSLPEPLRGDVRYIKIMLQELIKNALQHTQSGEIYIGNEMIDIDEQSNTIKLRFEVRDTGCGISPAKLQTLFTPFTNSTEPQQDKPAQDTPKMGMYVVRKLAQLMGGEVFVGSVPNLGSRFWFDIPLAISQQHTKYTKHCPINLKDRYIMLVSDDETSQEIIKKYLKSWHAKPIIARDGQEALRMLRNSLNLNEPFHSIILDLGRETNKSMIQALRQNYRYDRIPLIIVDATELHYDDPSQNIAAIIHTLITRPRLSKALSQSSRMVVAHKDHEQNPILSARQPSILLYEPHQVDALITTTILDEARIQTDLINHEDQLIPAIIERDYQLIMLSLKVSNSGFYDTHIIEDLRHWERHNGQSPLPIIAMAPFIPGSNPNENLKAHGVAGYIPKPVHKHELLTTIQQQLKLTR